MMILKVILGAMGEFLGSVMAFLLIDNFLE